MWSKKNIVFIVKMIIIINMTLLICGPRLGRHYHLGNKNWILLPPFTYIHRCRFRNVLKICRAFSTRWFPIHYDSIFNRMCGCSCIKEKCVFSPSQPLLVGKVFSYKPAYNRNCSHFIGLKVRVDAPKKIPIFTSVSMNFMKHFGSVIVKQPLDFFFFAITFCLQLYRSIL